MSFLCYALNTTEQDNEYLDAGQILTFSAIVLNDQFEVIDRFHQHCKYRRDLRPNPLELIKHGVGPYQTLVEPSSPEYEFATHIQRFFHDHTGAAQVGFRNYSCDDERLRRLFHRNLLNPYEREYKGGTTRWDIDRALGFFHAITGSNLINFDGISIKSDNPAFYTNDSLQAICDNNNIAYLGESYCEKQASAIAGMLKFLMNHDNKAVIKYSKLLFENRKKIQMYDHMDKIGKLFIAVGEDIESISKTEILVNIGESIEEPEKMCLLGLMNAEPSVVKLHYKKSPAIIPLSSISDGTLLKLTGKTFSYYINRAKKILANEEFIHKIRSIKRAEYEIDPDPEYSIYGSAFFTPSENNKLADLHLLPFKAWEDFINENFCNEPNHEKISILAAKIIGRNNRQLLYSEDAHQIRKSFNYRILTSFTDENKVRSETAFKEMIDDLLKTEIDNNQNITLINDINDVYNKTVKAIDDVIKDKFQSALKTKYTESKHNTAVQP